MAIKPQFTDFRFRNSAGVQIEVYWSLLCLLKFSLVATIDIDIVLEQTQYTAKYLFKGYCIIKILISI